MSEPSAPIPPSPDVAARQGVPFRFNPRLDPEPDPETGAAQITVDLPDGPDGRPSNGDMFAAMEEAARLLFGDLTDDAPEHDDPNRNQ